MARWTKRCNEFVDVRELIDAEDYNGILKKLSEICDKYANENWDYADDFLNLKEDDIDLWVDDDEVDEDTIDWIISEFYDLCDASGVWLELG